MLFRFIVLYAVFLPYIIICKQPHPYSQCKQDTFINEHFFHNKKHGIFVDIGAHDGVTYSNSYFYEKKLKWSGICVEPMPKVFAQLKKNRKCACIQGCITDSTGVKDFLRVTSPYLATEMLSGLLEKYDPAHLIRVDQELAQHGGSKEIIKVQCYTFEYLTQKYNISHIDYLSIDTEGGEFDILKTIDFNTVIIDVIDVENNFPENTVIYDFLTHKGFSFVKRLGRDEIYVRSAFIPPKQ